MSALLDHLLSIPMISGAAFISGILSGYVLRYLMKLLSTNKIRKSPRNIGFRDRLLRFILAFGLLIWAGYSDWSPLLLLFSGFTFFEAFAKWCGLFAALGKSSCSIN